MEESRWRAVRDALVASAWRISVFATMLRAQGISVLNGRHVADLLKHHRLISHVALRTRSSHTTASQWQLLENPPPAALSPPPGDPAE